MNIVRYVNLAFAAAGLLTWVVTADFYATMLSFRPEWQQDILGPDFLTSDLMGFSTGFVLVLVLWKHARIRANALDIGTELSRVVWPGWDETKQSTFVVIVVTIIISLILGFFDYLWAWLTKFIYG